MKSNWISERDDFMQRYYDKNNNEIKEGMTIKHDDGDLELIYSNWDGDDLGINASNAKYTGNMMPQIYPLYQFNLKEWEIVK